MLIFQGVNHQVNMPVPWMVWDIASQVLVRANHLQQSFEQRFSLQMRLVTGFTSMHLGDKCVWNQGFP